MNSAPFGSSAVAIAPSPRLDWRALQRRWWVEYNPLALVSAALVLGGLTTLSGEIHFGGIASLLLSGVAELYACCLIGGAAFLHRIGKPRAAVIIALLAVVFQADLTLHVETSAYLPGIGWIAAALWFGVFALKLAGLSWALRLRLSISTWAVALGGAAGLAGFPHLLRYVGGGGGTLVALWLFGLGAAGVWTAREVRSEVPLDVRGRRALRFTWGIWAAAVIAHAAFWASEYHLDVVTWPGVLALLSVRFAHRESRIWTIVGGALLATWWLAPSGFGLVALCTSVVLAIAGVRTPPGRWVQQTANPGPYREARGDSRHAFEIDHAARARLLVGAACALYLAVWMSGADSNVVAPPHPLWALVALTVGVGYWAERRSRPVRLAVLAPFYAHHFMQSGWLRLPDGALEWGAAATLLGFLALAASLLVQWRGRGPDAGQSDAGESDAGESDAGPRSEASKTRRLSVRGGGDGPARLRREPRGA